jgi:release factor glutamine methyltransferase
MTSCVTVIEGIQKSTEFLAKKGVESPRLQAELLLAHVLKLPRMKLYLNFERALADAETDTFRDLVKRRSQREPLQHITGFTSFCGLEIAVNRSVLVPRPETEMLAELGWRWLQQGGDPKSEIQNPNVGNPIALDFGTGSGCIAIALAVKCPAAKVVALDVSAEALEIAKQNAARNGVVERIEFVQGDGLAALNPEMKFNLIISNPPYIPSAEIETLDPEVCDYDPRSALDGGADGLDFYRRIATDARACLKADGKIMLEFGDGQTQAIRKLFEAQNWIVEAIHADYTQRERFLIAKS